LSTQSGRYSRAFIVTDDVSAGWARAIEAEMVRALRSLGHNAVLHDVKTTLDARGEPSFVIDINHKLRLLSPLRKFSIMVDHPCTRLKDLEDASPATDVLGWVDASHLAAATALGVRIPSIFLPHAGPEPVAQPLPMDGRDIDVFFSGALAEPVDRGAWKTARPDLSAVLVDAIFDAVEEIGGSTVPVLPAFLETCAGRGINPGDFSRELFCDAVSKTLEFAELNRRTAILAALPDVRITVASKYLPAALRGRTNLTHLGYVEDFGAVRQLMARAKIVINMTNKFPQGSHERIWYGMAEGAIVLTDLSQFLQQDFADRSAILYLPQRRVAAEDFEDLVPLLERPAALQDIRDRATPIYRAKHTWRKRAQTLWQVMQS
jgi:hypothetical protein